MELVSLQHIDQVWPMAQEFMQKALEKNARSVSIAELHMKARKGDAFLFVHTNDAKEIIGATLVDIVPHIDGFAGRIWGWGASERLKWSEEFQVLWKFLKDRNVNKAYCNGRKGLERMFPGARVVTRIYEMDL